jgi:prepilin peptidase CpaA
MNTIVYLLIALELFIVSWWDLKHKRISNLWSIANITIAVGCYLFWPGQYSWAWEVLIFPFGFIVGGFALFLLHIMGAGDSKFLASLFLILPLEFHLTFFEKLLLTTIVVGGILLIVKMLKNPAKIRAYFMTAYWQGVRDLIKSHFSYAPVIGLAWILLGASLWL